MEPFTVEMTDGGIETVLLFHDGLDLPHFAAFPLLYEDRGREAMRRYFESFLTVADARGLPLALGAPTWRANRDWGERLGYSRAELAQANADAVALVREIARGHAAAITVEGVLGPRGDGYSVGERMTVGASESYHADQIAALGTAGVDRLCALTLTYPEEAIGVVRAARSLDLPVVVSFTVETDGRLPDGTSLGDAIEHVDRQTDAAAVYFMVNCAHPSHIGLALDHPAVTSRLGGLRPNASAKSHAELDEATELDEGDPVALARETAQLCGTLPRMQLLGGCCGTDARHVAELMAAWPPK
jgi:homocysteine S-methyltransferase